MAKVNDYTNLWEIALVHESSSLKGKTFSTTGHVGITRDKLIEVITNNGGRFEARPKYGVNYLITNLDWNKGSTIEPKKSSKLIEAERNGIKIISEAQFCAMVIKDEEEIISPQH